ncbi:MAG: hypothetical protein JWL85_375, partial [Candidatus Saccharibacteria bacterium]|nr:hypothetical protein [Candidatus Saccharibacteria bacterium]
YATTALFYFAVAKSTGLLYKDGEALQYAWGFRNPPGPYNILFILWLVIMLTLGVALLHSKSVQIINKSVKRQQQLFIFSFVTPLIIGLVVDGIFPLFGIQIVPVSLLAIALSSSIIGYAILRHNLFSFSAASAASNVVATISQGVIGVNEQYVIEYVNEAAESIIERKSSEIIGSPLSLTMNASEAEKVIDLLQEQAQDSPSKTIEINVTQKGSIIPVSITASIVYDDDNNSNGYVLVLTNLSGDKESLLVMAEQTNQLQRNKLAMLNLLEDARELETDLTREKDRMSTIMNSIGEGLFVTDKEGKIVYLNPVSESIMGVTLSETIGKPYYEMCVILSRGKQLDIAERPIATTLTTGKTIRKRLEDDFTIVPTNRNAKPFAVAITTTPLTRDGKVDGVVAVINDITAEKHATEVIEQKVIERTLQAQEARARLESSINSLNVGFIMTNTKDELLTVNGAATHILFEGIEGIKKPEYITLRNINKNFGSEFDLLKHIADAMKQNKPVEIKSVDYHGRILRVFIAPIIDKDNKEVSRLGSVILIEDMTEQRLLERSKDEFFSIASHELRTPLTAIRGNTSLIQSYYGDQLKDDQLKEMISDIYDSSVRLIDIVNDFLDASRLEQGKMKFEYQAFHIDEIVESVVYEMGTVSKEKGVTVQYDHKTLKSSPQVYADKNRIKQIVYNLVGNALKFTEKGDVSVSTSVEGNQLKVLVSDSGRGMSREGQQLLFHKFQQTGSSLLTRDTTRGTGLGLYISKLLTERMGGKIKLESSEIDKGSVFSFTVPIATDDQKQTGIKVEDTQTR